MFDTDNFLDFGTDDAFSTEMKPVPEREYRATVTEKMKHRRVESTKNPGESFLVVDLNWMIDDPALAEELGRDPIVRHSVFVDLTPDGTGMAKGEGKNIRLGQLRDAVGQNVPGQPWKFGHLVGQCALIKVKHNTRNGVIYAEVDGVAPLPK